MAHRGQAPENHRQGKARPRSHAVDESAHRHHAHGVRRLKRKHEIAVVDLVPAQIMLQSGFQYAKHLPIHVVLRGAKQQQRANHPPEIAGRSRHCRPRFH